MGASNLLALLLLGMSVNAAADDWEPFPDGSMGQQTEFHGVGGVPIPAYIRKPKGPGPFPVVVMLHGGRYGKAATHGLARTVKWPTPDFVKAGWAMYSIDYRPNEKSRDPIETDDTIAAITTVRKLPFVEPHP
jgi:dienelactone hydrolase